jgi:hypothetical protein
MRYLERIVDALDRLIQRSIRAFVEAVGRGGR